MSEEIKGNSNTGDNSVNDSDDFFGRLEDSVNGIVSEGEVDNA